MFVNVCQLHTLLFSLARQQFGPQCIQDRQKPSGSTSLPDQVVKLVAQVPLQVWVRTDWERLRLDDQYKKTAKDGQRCQSQFPSPGQWPTSSPRPKAAQGTQLTGRPPIAGGWTRSAAHRSGKMDKALVLAPIFIHFHWDSLHIRRGSGPRLICMWVASTSLPGGHHALLQSCCGLAALDADAGRGLSEKCWTTPKSIGVSWYIYIYIYIMMYHDFHPAKFGGHTLFAHAPEKVWNPEPLPGPVQLTASSFASTVKPDSQSCWGATQVEIFSKGMMPKPDTSLNHTSPKEWLRPMAGS